MPASRPSVPPGVGAATLLEPVAVIGWRTKLESGGAALGSGLVIFGLVIVWAARISLNRDAYVSEMGAAIEPTAKWFQLALLLIGIGGALIAVAARAIRSRLWLLALWTPAVSLWIAGGLFVVDSQITCTRGCPLPYGASFTWQDLIHTVAAVLAFAAACIAMLQIGFAVGHRGLARFSLLAALLVALIAGAGGILSLLRMHAGFGSRLELLATTVAIAWLATLGFTQAIRLRYGSEVIVAQR